MKGQAFDTFKLMIAAVIAVAILGILLAILGGITLPGQNPATMIKAQLQQATQYSGSSFVSQTESSFQKGANYSQDSFLSTLGGTGSVTFSCDSGLSCTPSSDGSSVMIDNPFKATIKAKCNADNPRTCCVGIGANAVLSC